MNDPVSGRLNPLLLFLHGFLTAEHTQGELIDSGLHHGPKLPLHKTMLPGSPLQIVKADHGLFPLPFEAHRVAVLLRVLAPRVIFLYRVLPLKNIIPISLLLLAAGKRIGFVFHGVVSVAVALGGGAFGLLLGRCCALNTGGRAVSSPVTIRFFSYVLQTALLPLCLQCEYCKLRQSAQEPAGSGFLGYRHLPTAWAPAAQKAAAWSQLSRHCGLIGTRSCTLFT